MQVHRQVQSKPNPLPCPTDDLWSVGPATLAPIARLDSLSQRHPLWSHPFLERCRSGTLGLAEVRALSVQMYKFSREFGRYLSAVLQVCPDEESQLVIADNLWDELGHGDITQTHVELFRVFTRGLGIDDDVLEQTPAEPETLALIETYLEMARRRGFQAALGAICYGSEGIVSTLYKLLQDGIVASQAVPREALRFFDLHLEVDDGHKERLEALLLRHMRTPEDIKGVVSAVTEALNARYRFLDGVTRVVAPA